MRVFNALGKEMQIISRASDGIVFGDALLPGVYFVEILSGNQWQVMKIVKE